MNISRRLERLPVLRFHWFLLVAMGVGWLFDAMDVGLVSFVMPAIAKEWKLLPAQLGLVGSAGMLGMAVGAALAGMVADTWGRRTVITITLAIYGLATGLAGLSTGLAMLLAMRFLVGLGLGGELPVASTLMSEFSPARVRGRMVVLLESFWAWGWILAALISFLFIPRFGWRLAFFLGALPALYALYFRRAVPESPRFLERHGRLAEAEQLITSLEREAGISPPAQEEKEVAQEQGGSGAAGKTSFLELWSRRYLRRTLCLWILWLGINYGYYGFVTWLPSIMVGKGFSLITSFQYVLLMTLAQVPGYYSAAYLIEKVGRKAVLVVYLGLTAVSAYFFGQSASVAQLITWGALIYFFNLGAWGGVYAYTPELYPTRTRASGSGWAAAVGRLGAITAPMAIGLVYQRMGQQAGYGAVFTMLSLVFMVTALSILILGIETRGRTLEEIGEN